MESSNSKRESLITQLHSRTNETKEAFARALAELEKQYQEQLEQLEEERRKWDEEKSIIEKLVASASPIVHLNVGGEDMSTSRTTLTLVDGSLLATMFSGKWDGTLIKDADGRIFLDYNPALFKYLLNQLRDWSNPSVKRVFHLPVGSEQSFLHFVRSLNFSEGFINDEASVVASAAEVAQPKQEVESSTDGGGSTTTSVTEAAQSKQESEPSIHGGTSTTTSATEVVQMKQEVEPSTDGGISTTIGGAAVGQPEQKVERFRTTNSSDIQLTDGDRRCEKITQHPNWQHISGTLDYSNGTHRIRLKLEKGHYDILLGICSLNKPPTGPYLYDKPTTHGWFIHGYTVVNGQNPKPQWSAADENDILELIINCDERSLSILNENTQAKSSMRVDINEAPFPWCLLVLFHYKGSRVSLV